MDGYDLAGYRARVSAAGEADALVRALLRGFGPIHFDTAVHVPHYELTREGTCWHVRRDGVIIQTDTSPIGAAGALEWHIVASALEHRRDLFHLHGGALVAPDGRDAIVLAGDSGAGKTTLMLGLMTRGFLPLGDDVTLIDPLSWQAQPLRRAFHVSAETLTVVGAAAAGRPVPCETDMPAGYLYPREWARVAAPVRLLLFIQYRPHQVPDLRPMSLGEAAAAVLAHAGSRLHAGRLALATSARLAERVACYRFLTGDLDASLDAVLRLRRSENVGKGRPGA